MEKSTARTVLENAGRGDTSVADLASQSVRKLPLNRLRRLGFQDMISIPLPGDWVITTFQANSQIR